MNGPILCATNFSDPAIGMCDAAAAIAAKLNVTLVLVHACDAFLAGGETLSHSLHLAAQDRLAAMPLGKEIQNFILYF